MLSRIFILFLWTAALSPAANVSWLKLKSENFEVYTTAGQANGQTALVQFEKVRSYFQQTMTRPPKENIPVRIVLFQSQKEFAPYSPSEAAAAFYQPGRDADFIVMTAGGPPTIAIHEYVHLLIQRSGAKIPVWLNEGLADLYSSMRPLGKQVIVGAPPAYRMQLLRNTKWVPLDQVLRVDHDSAHYNDKEKAGIYYAESWVLTHMLMMTPEYLPKVEDLLTRLASGEASVEALEKTYGMPIGKLQAALESYVRRGDLMGMVADVKISASAEKPAISPASVFEAEMLLADILSNGAKRQGQAKAALEKLALANPAEPGPPEALGYLAWRENKRDEAKVHFEKAFSLGSKNTKMLLDLARFQRSAADDDFTATISRLTELVPNHTEAWMLLGGERYNKQLFAQALAALLQIKSVTPEQAMPYFRMISHSHFQMNQKEEAVKAAEKLRALASTPADIDDAERLMRYVRQDASVQSVAPLMEAPVGDDRPRTVRRPEDAVVQTIAPRQPNTLTAAGKFVEFNCDNQILKVGLLAGTQRLMFHIEDPQKMFVRNKGDATVTIELNCGAQKEEALTVEYVPRVDAKLGTIGVVRVLEFR